MKKVVGPLELLIGSDVMYREAWIKSRTMGRPVPAPPQGVVAGPCIDNQAPQAAKAPTPAPAVDLLDVGAEAEKPKASKAAPAQTDLLNFDGPAVSNSKETDLLGGGSAAGDLLGLSGGTANQANDLLSLGAGGGVPLDFGAGAQVPSVLPSSTPAIEVPAQQVPAPAPAAAAPPSRPAAAPLGSNTLGGGAKLVEQPQEKADDPFALALKQWNM
ncbi:hypothetical protein AK812_SmicGene11246 [Symbiodinium microadriaticum]|uniref:Uncharacterized protein n=1 Tax=Symbiodinium microadriaticum TaxID=2951 RepID=A0A1Q9EDU0_SYMMI|nr:hypothetical protein AK812_SmicGene11246 [Symbiodinium microadriaticum]